MKKILSLLLVFVIGLSLSGCNVPDDEIDDPSLTGASILTLEVGDEYVEYGVDQLDVEVVITGVVDTSTIGTYIVRYTVTVEDRDAITLQRTVNVVDTTLPVITLSGGSMILVEGASFTDPGATAQDNYDGNITSSIVVTGAVDTNTPGTYILKYNVVDSSDNSAVEVERTVTVHAEPNTAPVISIIGESSITITVGDIYTDQGATATDAEDGDLTSSISVNNTVNVDVAGSYTVTYNVNDSKGVSATTVTRTVIVEAVYVNIAPVITLIGDASITITVGDTYTDQGATADDNLDGDITTSIVTSGSVDTATAGTYTIIYNVIDSEGLAAIEVTRTVIVEVAAANAAPVITLVGNASITITVGDTYTDQGATATDTEDGDLTSSIVVVNPVDVNTAGTYTITYNVVDSGALVATTVTRTVIVQVATANVAPVITLVGNANIVLNIGDTYTELGATATDAEDGDLTSAIVTAGTVDINTAGTYTITYNVNDNDGLAAMEVTRTVIVQDAVVGEFNRVYIEKDMVIDWDAVLTQMSITIPTAAITFDTSVVGETTLDIDGADIIVTVFEQDGSKLNLYPGSILIMNNGNINADLVIVANQQIQVTLIAESLSHFEIYTTGIDAMFAVSSNYSTGAYPLFIDSGIYSLRLATYSIENKPLVVKIESLALVTEVDGIVLAVNDFNYIKGNAMTQEYTFNVLSNGDFEIDMYSSSQFIVTIYDSLDNVIITRRSDILSYNLQGFYLFQNFAVGEYHIEVEYLTSTNTMHVFLSNEYEHDNYGYVAAHSIDLEQDETLQVLIDRNWYSFTVVTPGFYYFRSSYQDFYIFSGELEELSYAQDLLYLEAGDYYLNYDHSYGEIIVNISLPTASATPNNTKLTANDASALGEFEAYFDDPAEEKWFEFTLAAEAILNIALYEDMNYQGAQFTLYDALSNELILDSEFAVFKLEAGTYYLKLTGVEGTYTRFNISEINVDELDTTELTPEVILLGDVVESYIGVDDTHYIEFVVDTAGIYEFYLGSDGNKQVVLSLGSEVLVNQSITGGMRTQMQLEVGTYSLSIQALHKNDVYLFTVDQFVLVNSGYSLDINTAPLLDTALIQEIFVENGGISVYQEIVITEPAFLTGYALNVAKVIVYDDLGNVYKEGDPWAVFPILFDVGTYTIELVSYDMGVIVIIDPQFSTIENYGSDFDSATVMSNIVDVAGFNNNDVTIDIISFSVTVDTLYVFENQTQTNYMILDANMDYVVSSTEEYLKYIQFTPGDYYLIVNETNQAYGISIYKVNNRIPGHTVEDATGIYINEGFDSVFVDQFEPAYFKFTVIKDSYLIFEYPNYDAYMEILDGNLDYHVGTFFTPGEYYIKLSKVNYSCDGVCPVQPFMVKVTDISAKVINNDMATAVDLVDGSSIKGQIVSNLHETWLTFTVDSLSSVYIYIWAASGTFEFYDSDGVYLRDLVSSYNILEAGTYYVKITGDLGNYQISTNTTLYVPISDTLSNALIIEFEDLPFNQIIKDGTDKDWYKLVVTENMLVKYDFSGANVNLYDDQGDWVRTILQYTFEYVSPGTYYFEVSNYTMSNYYIAFADRSELLIGEDFASATPIDIKTYVYGYKLAIDENDYFSFSLDKDMTIQVNTLHTYEIYDSSHTLVTTLDLTIGDYYIVFVGSNYMAFYNFIIDEAIEASTGGIDNTLETAVVITETYFDLVEVTTGSDTSDWYTITLTEAVFYVIQDNKWGNHLMIYDADELLIHDLQYYPPTYLMFQPGTYYIEVTGAYSDYDLSFAEATYKDFPDTSADAYELILYETVGSFLLSDTDVDWFEFSVTRDSLLRFNLSGNCNYEIYDSLDALLYDNSDNLFLQFDTGTYKIKVINTDTGLTKYDLSITDYTSYVMTDDSTQALQRPITDHYTFVKGYMNGVDSVYFKLDITEETTIVFENNVYVTVLDSSLAVVTNPVLPIGVYYIKVDLTSEGIFTIGYKAVDDIVETNSSNREIFLGEMNYVYSFDGLEVDSFVVAPTHDAYINFEMIHNINLTILVKDSLDNIIFDETVYRDSASNYKFFLHASETYTITVTTITGDYAFKLQENLFYDASDVEGTAEVINLDEEYSTIIYDNVDEDWYTFTLTEETLVSINTAGVLFELLDDTETVLTTSTSAIILPSGIYYVKFTQTYKTDYSFTVVTH